MTLTDLSEEKRNNPNELASFFAENPALLVDDTICLTLYEWLEAGNTAIPYVLSKLSVLTDKEQFRRFDAFFPYFITAYTFEKESVSLPDWLNNYDENVFRQYCQSEKLGLAFKENPMEISTLGMINAFVNIDCAKDHLPPLLYRFAQDNLKSEHTSSKWNKMEKLSSLILAYWKHYSHVTVFKKLHETCVRVPPKLRVDVQTLAGSLTNILQEKTSGSTGNELDEKRTEHVSSP